MSDQLKVERGEGKHVAPGTEDAGTGWFVCRPDGSPVCWVQHVEDANLFAASHDLLESCESMIPENVCLTNPNVRDDTVLPLDVTLGDLRKVAAVITKARGETS